jgi:Rad3-related DNA helicase
MKSNGKLISYWCFSSALMYFSLLIIISHGLIIIYNILQYLLYFRMQQLLDEGVRSIILTSGTLSPLRPFISEIGIEISVQLENPHIISEKQIYVNIISTGYNGYSLNSSYNTRYICTIFLTTWFK